MTPQLVKVGHAQFSQRIDELSADREFFEGAGRVWAFRQSKKVEPLEENFIRRLHLKMFENTWTWAGTFRTTDKSIGVPSEQVAMRLAQLVDNTRYQRDLPARRTGDPVPPPARVHPPLCEWQRPPLALDGRHPGSATGLRRVHLGCRRRPGQARHSTRAVPDGAACGQCG